MAQIELRHATIRIVDGYSNSGAVNDTPADGDTTLTVDGIVGAIPKYAKMTIAGANATYRVTATVETMGNTTSVTFEPALATADGVPVDDAVITFGGRFVEAKIGDGNLDYTENRNMDYRLDKGELDTVREGDDAPMDVKLDFVWEFLRASSGDEPTLEDALKRRGEASGWTSSDSDTCAPYGVDIEIEHDPPCTGEDREFILLPDFRWESLEHNAKDAQISVAGKCNSKEAVVSRAA
jgi:hypothetical protein